jgi:opacity protein-like surface antigen
MPRRIVTGRKNLRYLVYLAVICLGIISTVHAAVAQSPWYVSGSAGVLQRSDTDFSITISNYSGLTGPDKDSTSFNPGPIINLAIGYRLLLGFRLEGELGYRNFSVSSISPLSTDVIFPNLVGNRLTAQSGGERNSYTATVNGFYDFPVGGPFVPYAGAGVGIVYGVDQSGLFAGPGVPRFVRNGSSGTAAIVLAEVGVTIAIGPTWSIVPAYRFEHGFSGTPTNDNILKVGLRYSF